MALDQILPTPNEDSKPYWDGLKEGRLMLQKCGGCGAVRHYPRPVCDKCYSMEVEWIEAAGTGVIHTWTVSHHAFHPAFKGETPTTFATIDLAEGVRLCARLKLNDGEPSIGMPVKLGFEPMASDLMAPVATPA